MVNTCALIDPHCKKGVLEAGQADEENRLRTPSLALGLTGYAERRWPSAKGALAATKNLVWPRREGWNQCGGTSSWDSGDVGAAGTSYFSQKINDLQRRRRRGAWCSESGPGGFAKNNVSHASHWPPLDVIGSIMRIKGEG